MTTIEIDGKTLTTEAGRMIIEAADNAGIYIPRFCYHKKLSIAANCRMCLVEVEKSGKPLPACATPVSDGMKVFTRSAKALDAQRTVMEFLLINHPLDCPICDQGGECELQDLSMGFGKTTSPFDESKRAVDDEDLGSLIASDMTRCIQCTRCVRFQQEITGKRELGATDRGEDMRIGTYIKKNLDSELSGNIIDVCPVGALTSKPFRFKGRAWEMLQKPSISPHDCVGSNLSIHSRRGVVLRVVPRANEEINEVWLSDRDRFSYTGLYHADRLSVPMIKQDGEWQEVDWPKALEFTRNEIKKLQPESENIGALLAPTATLEESFLLQKIIREIGSPHIDHRLQQTDLRDQDDEELFPNLGQAIKDIEDLNYILLIGSNTPREQPIVAHKLRKAKQNDARISVINPMDFAFNFEFDEKFICHPLKLAFCLAQLAKACVEITNFVDAHLVEQLAEISYEDSHRQWVENFIKGERKAIILGALALNNPQASIIRYLAKIIAKAANASYGCLTSGSNSAGAWIAGAIPHRNTAGCKVDKKGFATQEMLQAKLKSYWLFNLDPELDCANPALVREALSQAQFNLVFSPYISPALLEYAHVILPIVPFTETDGTFVNIEGRWQSFKAIVEPVGTARPGWKILRVLGNYLHLPDFGYENIEEIQQEIRSLYQQSQPVQTKDNFIKKLELELPVPKLTRITEWQLYATDNLVRRSLELQASAAEERNALSLNQKTCTNLNLSIDKLAIVKQKNAEITLPILIDERIPDGCVRIANGRAETSFLGESFGEIEVISQ